MFLTYEMPMSAYSLSSELDSAPVLLAMGQTVSLVTASCMCRLSSHQTASVLLALQAAFIGVPLVSAMVIDKQLKPDVKGW